MNVEFLKAQHEAGVGYDEYVAAGTPAQQENWSGIYKSVGLSETQSKLVRSFVREMKVIVLSGVWCGDCVQQGPLIQRIAEANPEKIDLRWLERDQHMDLSNQITINGGNRVPIVIFCAEDYEPVGWFGDRVLSRYRKLAAKQLGASCPLPGTPVPKDELDAAMAEWLDQFERVQLLLRLSGRLRQKHGD